MLMPRVALAFDVNETLLDLHALDRATNGLAHGIRPNDVAFICRQPRGVLMRDAGDDWS